MNLALACNALEYAISIEIMTASGDSPIVPLLTADCSSPCLLCVQTSMVEERVPLFQAKKEAFKGTASLSINIIF